MNQTFILQNQDKLFFGKSKEWVDGYDANALFKTPHKDEAVNQMFEITSKDYKQRVKVLTCDLDEKALPIIDSEIMPAPLPKVPKPPKAGEDLFAEPQQSNGLNNEQVNEQNNKSTDEPEEPEEELTFSADATDDASEPQSSLI